MSGRVAGLQLLPNSLKVKPMGIGNKGFADDLAVTSPQGLPEARKLPRMGILGGRENRLAELATGKVVTRMHELIDPARCKIWDYHNRDYQALSQEACADLIESFKSQGKQEVPAIVRRVKDDPQHDFEVICGARRHWTASWLRAHDRPDFSYLIEVRELTDEEAFRLADLENRQRKDLSDYERAADYARAIERYYAGSQQRMADRLEVTKSWLSRYLDLARLPPEVIGAFGTPHAIGISHAAALAPKLRNPSVRDSLLEAARAIAAEQAALKDEGKRLLPPSAVVARLQQKQLRKAGSVSGREAVLKDDSGEVTARASRRTDGSISVHLSKASATSRITMLSAFKNLIDQLNGDRRI